MTGPVTTEVMVDGERTRLIAWLGQHQVSVGSAIEREATADALVADFLAPLLAAPQQVTAERDRLRVACLAVQKSIARFPGSVHDRAMAKIDKALGVVPSDFVDPDEAELTRLRAEGEALKRKRDMAADLVVSLCDSVLGNSYLGKEGEEELAADLKRLFTRTALARAATTRDGA